MIFDTKTVDKAADRIRELATAERADRQEVIAACAVVLLFTAIAAVAQAIQEKPPWVHQGRP
jgi:hypothetical protein